MFSFLMRPTGSIHRSKDHAPRAPNYAFMICCKTQQAVCPAKISQVPLVSSTDFAAAARAADTRKTLGDHEQHERQRQASHKSGYSVGRQIGRGRQEAAGCTQAVCSLLIVGLVFMAFLYWTIKLAMPR